MRRWGFDILRARTIVFGAKNIGVCFPHLCPFFVLGIHGMYVVGLDFGILVVWVVLLCVMLLFLQWVSAEENLRVWRRGEDEKMGV